MRRSPRLVRALLALPLAAVAATASVAVPVSPAGALACQAATPGASTGTLDWRLRQASGLARSADQGSVLWTHNDYGIKQLPAPGEDTASAAVWAVGLDARVLGRFTLADRAGPIAFTDTEAIALAPDGRMVLADTGTNKVSRTTVELYAFTPPAVDPGQAYVEQTVPAVRIPLRFYESATATTPVVKNVEAFVIDADGSTWFIPRTANAPVDAYRATSEALATAETTGQPARAERAVLLGVSGSMTDASRSPGGEWLVVKSLTTTWAWSLGGGRTVADALVGAPCVVATAAKASSPGYGEAVTVADDGSFVTVREASKDPTRATNAKIWPFTA